jgi:hypothetical protein
MPAARIINIMNTLWFFYTVTSRRRIKSERRNDRMVLLGNGLVFAMAASQNGFGIHKLSLHHKKTKYYFENDKKDIRFLFYCIFYHRTVVK